MLFGGLSLFIYGMKILSRSLQSSVGETLRDLIQQVSKGRIQGFMAGTAMSFTVHSSAATVMIVGFLSAGLLSFTQSIPLLLGANVGTTLSMQLVSFKLGKYCYIALAIGFLMTQVCKRENFIQIGWALFGFGLLFLGMNTMALAIRPLRDLSTLQNAGVLEVLVSNTSARTWRGMLFGIVLWSLITGLIQSSGATLAMAFTLCQQGLFQDLQDIFPCLLGAHIGTCVTAALGSLGANERAKRAALAHFIFNIFSTLLACLFASLYFRWIPLSSGDLTRQAANANTIIQLSAALLCLPFTQATAKIISRFSPFKKDPKQTTHLDRNLLNTPEMALVAAVKETRQVARLTRSMLNSSMESFLDLEPDKIADVRQMGERVSEHNRKIKEYLAKLTERELSQRQSVFLQFLSRTTTDLSLMARRLENFGKMTRQRLDDQVWFDNEDVKHFLELYGLTRIFLDRTIKLLKPFSKKTQKHCQRILDLADNYQRSSQELRQRFRQKVTEKQASALSGLYYATFIQTLDHIVETVLSLASLRQEPLVFIKREKLENPAPQRPQTAPTENMPPKEPFGEGKSGRQILKEFSTKAKQTAKLQRRNDVDIELSDGEL